MNTSSRCLSLLVKALALKLMMIAMIPFSSLAKTYEMQITSKSNNVYTLIVTGQNLPALSSTRIWAIGDYPQDEIVSYHNHQASRDQASIAGAAIEWTNQWVQTKCNTPSPIGNTQCKLAAVFDVDDTILSSYNSDKISPTSFTHDSVTSDRAVESCSTPVIEPVRKAYKAFRSWGVATIVITGRSKKQKKVTMDCLESFGMGEWDEAHFKPQSYIGTASAWKHQIRQQIIEKGWDIGPSIGDQLSDMSYGSFSRGFLMPNVRYFIK